MLSIPRLESDNRDQAACPAKTQKILDKGVFIASGKLTTCGYMDCGLCDIHMTTLSTSAEFNAWYAREDPWRVAGSAAENAKIKRIARELSGKNFDRALDIGCGEGHVTVALSKFAQKMDAVDFSEVALARAKKNYNNINFFHCSVEQINELDPGYDLISCLEVIYYLDEDSQIKALKDIKRLGRKNCTFLFSVVTSGENKHGKYFTLHEAEKLFSKIFKIKKSFTVSLLQVSKSTIRLRKLGIISKEAVHNISLRTASENQVYQTVFICY